MADEEKVKTTEPVEETETVLAEDDEVVVTIGEKEDEDSPPSDNDAPDWIKELRREHRNQKKENRKLKEQLESLTKPKAAEELGERPAFKDYDYDEAKYQEDLDKWFERKKEISKKTAKQEEERNRQTAEWQAVLDGHEEKKAKLKVKNFDEVESLVMDHLSVAQQGMIVQGADDSAKVVYALGTNPKKLQELAKIKDPVKFAFTVAKLETQLKTTTRKASTSPEGRIKGDAPVSGAIDSTLERLRADAEKTGDYTKVTEYRRRKRKSS